MREFDWGSQGLWPGPDAILYHPMSLWGGRGVGTFCLWRRMVWLPVVIKPKWNGGEKQFVIIYCLRACSEHLPMWIIFSFVYFWYIIQLIVGIIVCFLISLLILVIWYYPNPLSWLLVLKIVNSILPQQEEGRRTMGRSRENGRECVV